MTSPGVTAPATRAPDTRQRVADLLFVVQIGCALVFGVSQTWRMLSSVEGLSLSWFLCWALFLVVNLRLSIQAHRVQPSRVTRQTVWAYSLWTAIITANLAALVWHGGGTWTHIDDITLALVKGALQAYDERLEQFGEAWMAQAEREVLLNAVDVLWQRHLTDLDVLREGIGLVGYGGRDPLVEYKRESFHMWTELQDEIKGKVVQDIYRVVPRERAIPALRLSNIRTGRGAMPSTPAAPPEPVRNIGMYDNVGRNDPCPCGSGKKFKHCHYRELQQQRQTVAPEVVRHQAPRRRR